MAGFRTSGVFAPVPSTFTEVAPATLVGLFRHTFGSGQSDPIYIRPGHEGQQDYGPLAGISAQWLLYTRSVLSYRIFVNDTGVATAGGCSLTVELGDYELAGVMGWFPLMPFHLASGDGRQSCNSGIELCGLVARFRIAKGNEDAVSGTGVSGVIMLRAV